MVLGILRVLGIFIFLYLLWRNLKGEYEDQKIITYSWLSLLGFMFGGRLLYGLIHWGIWNDTIINWLAIWNKPGMSYMGAFLGLLLVSWIYGLRNQLKFLTLVEDIIKPILFLAIFWIIDEWLRSNFDLKPLIYLVLLLIDLLVVSWLKKRYRSFVWYKSGKKGFVLLASNFLFFLTLVITLILLKEKWINVFLALTISLISLVGLFILGEIKYEKK